MTRPLIRFLSGRLFPCLLALTVQSALAQIDQKSAPTPVAPGDLTRPMFDTRTPVYHPRLGANSAAAVMAEVEGRPITLGMVGDAIRALPPAIASRPFEEVYPIVLDRLLRQQAVVIRAQQAAAIDDPEIARRVRAAADHALVNEYLRRELGRGVTEADLLDRYQRDIAGRPGPEEVHLRAIAVRREEEAAVLIAELRGGADFAAVARRSSIDVTASQGGDLGFQTRDMLNPEIGAVVFALAPGRLHDFPVVSGGNWMVLRVEERRRRPPPAFPEMREELREAAMAEAVAKFGQETLHGMKVREFDLMGREVPAGQGVIR
ncbi:MAG: peptidylprolyl isomerase [Acetobacteraceae bacterium]|nr:peptidylprolyl isomerase [Acetobacteraceae bacterium]